MSDLRALGVSPKIRIFLQVAYIFIGECEDECG